MEIKIASYILLVILIFYRKLIFYGAANTDLKYYKTSRRFLWLLYVFGFAMFFIGPQIYGADYFLENSRGKILTAPPLFSMHSTLFVAVFLALDINYKFSRRNGYECNFIKAWLVGILGVIPFFISCWANKPLFVLWILVFIAGFGARKQLSQS